MRIAISIPCHEHYEVVCSQIENIRKYVKDPLIVLHLAAGMEDLRHLDDRFSDVVVNPLRQPTAAWGSLTQVHFSNLRCLQRRKHRFQYIALMASNELFVRRGVETYIEPFYAGAYNHIVSTDTNWREGQRALADPRFQRMLETLKIPVVCGSQWEGSFYRADLFAMMCEHYEDYYAYECLDYVQDEVFYPTLAHFVTPGIGAPYCLSSAGKDRRRPNLTLQQVQEVRDGLHPGMYTVKRVPRNLDDPVRKAIGGFA